MAKNQLPADTTDPVAVGLVVAVHTAIVEVQSVGVGIAVLGRRPIVGGVNLFSYTRRCSKGLIILRDLLTINTPYFTKW